MKTITKNSKLPRLFFLGVTTTFLTLATSCRDVSDISEISPQASSKIIDLNSNYEEGFESPELDSTRRKKNKPLPPKIDRIPW